MRKSTVHYIAPSTISVTPNANGSADDLAVYVMRGARIKVCSKGVPELVIDAATNSFMEWSFAGRNRRLADSARPYTIYARLSKTDVSDGYLVFAAKEGEGQDWLDKYPYVTPEGLAGDTAGYGTGNYWYIRLGDVSLPENGKRTVTLDTGVLGTDVFNADWYLNPDRNPLRVELSCTIGNQEKGRTPYVCWGESVELTASLVEGWEGDASGKVDHWTISRDTGNADSDAAWNAVDRSRTFGATGIITLAHNRGGDHFAGAVAATFTVKAWGEPEAQEPLAETVITILAETEETYSLEASDAAVTYNPLTQSYSPSGGVTFRIRAKAQDGSVSYLSQQQIQAALLHVYYLPADEEAGEDPVPELTFVNGTATLPVSAFSDGKSVNLWIENDAQAVLDRATVAYVRFGEKGDAPVTCYRWYRKGLTPLVPTDVTSEEPSPASGDATGAANVYPLDKWSRTSPNRPSAGDWLLWMCESIHHGSGTIDAWHGPVRVSAEDGNPGADSSDREYIYKGLATYPFSGTPPANITTDTGGTERTAEYIATHDDFVPQGWSDTAIPTDDTNNKYVYIAIREKAAGHNQQWGAFSAPALWSNWGMQGIDGDGVQYLYKLFDHELSDAERTSGIPANATFNNTTKEWEAAGWSDDPQAPTSAMPFCYCSIIQKLNGQWQTITGGYGRFQKLGLWSKWADDAVNYRLIVRPDGIIVDTTTGSVTNGDFTVEVWRTAGNGEDEHVQDLDDYGLSIVAGARGEEPDLSGEYRSVVVTRVWGDEQETFDSLLATFNDKLSSLGKNQVSDTGITSDVYEWLSLCYERADFEWNAEDSDYFDADNYKIPVDYRGDNMEYETTAYNAMQAWLMASCLAELIPSRHTSGTLTNNQTQLFRLAWDIARGDEVPLFNNYHIHADPMIARFAANMIYHVLRGKKEFSEFDTMRTHIGGSTVGIYDRELGYVGESAEAPSQLGYMINADIIIPDAPGPYATGTKDRVIGGVRRTLPSDASQFYLDENLPDNKNWWVYNYKKDVEIDEEICRSFHITVPGTYSNTAEGQAAAARAREEWEKYSYDQQLMIMKAVTAPSAQVRYFFGSKRVNLKAVELGRVATGNTVDEGIPYTTGQHVWTDRGFFRFGIDDSSNYLLGGPFADLQDVMFTGNWGDGESFGTETATLQFLRFIIDCGDDCRYPIYLPERGRRRRPLGGKSGDFGHRSEYKNGGPIFGDYIDGITNMSLTMIFSADRAEYDKRSVEDGWSSDKATSYPSGHSSQVWAAAMILGQMYSKTNEKKMIQYASAAYEVGIGRTISRHHWTSDTILGRLCATMITPIINAIDSGTFRSDYANAKSSILGGVSGGIIVKLKNSCGTTMTIKPQIRFILRNGSTSVRTSALPLASSSNLITIANGETKTFRGIDLDSANRQYLGLPFAKKDELVINPGAENERTYLGNILFYDYDGVSSTYVMPLVSSSYLFTDNTTYFIEYISNGIGNYTIEQNGNVGDSVISVNFNLINQSGRSVTLDGDINIILANPDSNGKYHGWTGPYGRTEHIILSSSPVTIANGGSRLLSLANWQDTTSNVMDASGNIIERNLVWGLGCRTPASQSAYSFGGYQSNVLLYIGGNSGIVTCDTLPSVLFEDGKTYDIIFR